VSGQVRSHAMFNHIAGRNILKKRIKSTFQIVGCAAKICFSNHIPIY